MLIVTYHAIESPASPVCCPPSQFEADMTALLDAGFSFVSLDDVADWLSGSKALPPRAVAVTFDDGYQSVVTHALPVLARLGLPAAVFVIGQRIGGDNRWPGQWPSIPTMPLADGAGLRELIAGRVTIGSHSWSHPDLTSVDTESLRGEVADSADRLEQTFGVPVRHFAYPYGFRTNREVTAAKQRFSTAVNAEPRIVTATANPHDLNRVDCHDSRVALRMKWFEPPALRPYLALRRGLRAVRRGVDRVTSRP
jgi:peptidoglycan/xylan/chitin deacetylase (PgdA/CDA1 family)